MATIDEAVERLTREMQIDTDHNRSWMVARVDDVRSLIALIRENERLTRELIAAGERHLADETTIRQLERELAALKGVKSDEH